MALQFRNMLTVSDEEFYRSNAESCLRAAYRHIGPPDVQPSPNKEFLINWYFKRAQEYRDAYDHLKLIRAGLLTE